MKKLQFAILLILVFCSVAIADIKDSPDGFRGIKWGYPPSALGASTLMEEAYGVQSYKKNNENLKIGKADLTEITYIFNKNKFVGVFIGSNGFNNSVALKTALILRYGSEFREDPEVGVVWIDKNAIISHEYKSEQDTTSVSIVDATAFMDMVGTLINFVFEEFTTESDTDSIADSVPDSVPDSIANDF